MGSDESHFNVSLIVRDKVIRQCPQTTTFEEKGEPKRIRTETPLFTSLTPYRYAKTGSRKMSDTNATFMIHRRRISSHCLWQDHLLQNSTHEEHLLLCKSAHSTGKCARVLCERQGCCKCVIVINVMFRIITNMIV